MNNEALIFVAALSKRGSLDSTLSAATAVEITVVKTVAIQAMASMAVALEC